MTEYDLIPFPSPEDPAVDFVEAQGSTHPRVGSANVGVWTVPDGVRSFSVGLLGGSDPVDPTRGPLVFFYNVPCTPGDQWLLEGGDGTFQDAGFVLFGLACQRNTFYGGDSLGAPHAGGGASVVSRRRGVDEFFAVVGGRGGVGANSGPYIEPVDGSVTYGGFTTVSGGSNGADQTTYVDSGAGGGGWPGGAAGATAAAPGHNGGLYLPDVPDATLGPIPSPSHAQLFGVGSVLTELGQVWIWYFRRPVGDWTIDDIPISA